MQACKRKFSFAHVQSDKENQTTARRSPSSALPHVGRAAEDLTFHSSRWQHLGGNGQASGSGAPGHASMPAHATMVSRPCAASLMKESKLACKAQGFTRRHACRVQSRWISQDTRQYASIENLVPNLLNPGVTGHVSVRTIQTGRHWSAITNRTRSKHWHAIQKCC